ncbi:RidA family protein [Methylobacterium sp. J-048]|uniref:RidA family protein n=1 Tax=unclassified Methylobacterium TaxID=2615210 RepID=UPI001FBA3FF9|nr:MULTISPECIES: RidA family protein [unclassified Methylobacterium]MCJ2060172.1 RidA family protein [Methylobacterium sp. J-048]MCJ2122376.1 RidA family protein [Methylobacterium sp. J-077]
MNGAILARLAAAGLALPRPTMPAANYVPFTRAGPLLFVAGQTPVQDGEPQYCGIVGEGITIEEAQAAARLCALNVLAQVDVALKGEPLRVRCLRLGGFVRCTGDFIQQARVLDGASDLMVLALGEDGRHARTTAGTNALPRGVPVEVEGVFELA